jgi:hypothetical protein
VAIFYPEGAGASAFVLFVNAGSGGIARSCPGVFRTALIGVGRGVDVGEVLRDRLMADNALARAIALLLNAARHWSIYCECAGSSSSARRR